VAGAPSADALILNIAWWSRRSLVSVSRSAGVDPDGFGAPPHDGPHAWARGPAGPRGRRPRPGWPATNRAENGRMYPLMCAALHAHGVAASRLRGTSGTAGLEGKRAAGVVVRPFGRRTAGRACVLARVGSGDSSRGPPPPPRAGPRLPEGRSGRPGARRSAGMQLLQSGQRIGVAGPAASTSSTGQVAPAMIMLAMLHPESWGDRLRRRLHRRVARRGAIPRGTSPAGRRGHGRVARDGARAGGPLPDRAGSSSTCPAATALRSTCAPARSGDGTGVLPRELPGRRI